MLQKLKHYISYAVLLLSLALPFGVVGTSYAAGGCTGSDAPSIIDCGTIPLGCPGSIKQGPISPTATLTCPYSPSATSYACPGAQCTFPNGITLTHGQAASSVNGATAAETAKNLGGNCLDAKNCDLIKNYVNPFINLLSALVGVAVVISIVIGGVQYGSSAGDSSKVAAAKDRIRNSILALITFMFLYALLNFLIPGGLV